MSRKSKLSGLMQAVHETQSIETSFNSDGKALNMASAGAALNRIQNIALSKIYVNPAQHRKYFDPDEQQKLKNAIEQNGFQGAVLLRPLPNTLKETIDDDFDFELVYGESRTRAVRSLGWESIPSVVKELTDREMHRIRLDENLVRKDLNPLEEMDGILEVAADELEIPKESILTLLDRINYAGKRRRPLAGDDARIAEQLQGVLNYYKKGALAGFRTKYRKLQRLPDDIKKAIQGKIDWSKAVEIAPVKNDDARKQLLELAIHQNLTVKDIRKKRRELESPKITAPLQNDAGRLRFYRALEKISHSEEWSNPSNRQRIDHLIQEIEFIFRVKIS